MSIFGLVMVLIGLTGVHVNGKPAPVVPKYEMKKLMEDPNLVEGDMVFPADGTRGRGVAMRGVSVPWPNGVVPYEIASNYNVSESTFIVNTMRKMERLIAINNFTCIRFRPKVATDTYYITITNGDGCSSPVGMNAGSSSPRIVTLKHPGCIYESTIMHELIHTLGFFHEQARPDRDNYIRVNYANVQAGMEHNFDRYASNAVDTQSTPYDYASVMHYGTTYFSANGQPTIEPLVPGAPIGQSGSMSDIDILEVRLFYNCSGGGVTVTRPTTSVTPNIYAVNTTISSTLTAGGPTFTRYSTGDSGYYYQVFKVNVSTTATYSIRCVSSIDTFGYMYADGFVANATGNNLFAYDDDSAGNSQFELSPYLQPNKVYYLVVTTYNPGDFGAFSIVASGFTRVNIVPATNTAPIVLPTVYTNYTSALTTTSPKFNRTSSSSLNYYEAIQINIINNGYYTFNSTLTNGVDTYGYLYVNSFNPNSLDTNKLKQDDDSAGNYQFQLSYSLQSTYNYILVFTTYYPNTQTPISITGWGPGAISYTRLNPTTTTTTAAATAKLASTTYNAEKTTSSVGDQLIRDVSPYPSPLCGNSGTLHMIPTILIISVLLFIIPTSYQY